MQTEISVQPSLRDGKDSFPRSSSQLCQPSPGQRGQPKRNPALVGAQRFQHNGKYLRPSGYERQASHCGQNGRMPSISIYQSKMKMAPKPLKIKVLRATFVVPVVGLEPTCHCWQQILSLSRMPISTHRQILSFFEPFRQKWLTKWQTSFSPQRRYVQRTA